MSFAFALLLAAAVDASTASAVLQAPLLPEGSDWNAQGSVVLAGLEDALSLGLPRPMRLRALLLQADFDDNYRVEGSLDGARWERLWTAPALQAPPGMRSRYEVLERPVLVAALRVRATSGAGAFSVARLRLYQELPAHWPPELDNSLPGRRAPLLPDLTPGRVLTLRLALGGVAFAVVLWCRLRPSRAARSALLVAGAVGALAWTNFGNFHFSGLVHGSEMFHYYVGAKYFPELGYDGLYLCSAAADVEDGIALEGRPIRDLRTNQLAGAVGLLASQPPCRSRFDPGRWAAFRRDVGYFRTLRGGEWWKTLTDHGHNATPVWNLAGRAIASLVPATDAGVTLLAGLDLLLLLALGGVLFVAFGPEAAGVAAIYFGLNALSRFAWTGGAFLRYDWLFLALGGLAALRAGHSRSAGFALGWAALLRLFPGVLLVGLALHAAVEAVLEGPYAAWSRLRPVVQGALLAALLLGGASELLAGRPGAWTGFVANSRKYLQSESENKLGLATALAYRSDTRLALLYDPTQPDPFVEWQSALSESARNMRPLRALLSAFFLGLLVASAARHREPWQTAALAAGLLPVLFQQANYYYGLLAAFALLWQRLPAVALGLVGLAWASEAASQTWVALDVRAAIQSALVCVFVYWAAWRATRRGA